MTIAEILELPNGSIVDPFEATLAQVKPRKSPNAPQHCTLRDSSGDIKLVVWKRKDLSASLQGKQTMIGGGKLVHNEYNGATTRELHLNPDNSFEPKGSASQHEAPACSPTPKPVTEYSSKRPEDFFQAFLHDAVAIQIEAYRQGELKLEHFGSKEFSATTYRITSDLYRICKLIGEGKLAPAAKEREALTEQPKDKVVQAAQELFTGDEE
jgi:hypothetical protein